jgi:glycosyltransferase involved in cell wall biosynthesis
MPNPDDKTPSDAEPFFSVVLPIRNEAAFIERTIASIQANDYPRDRVEIIVVDGMSNDGTLEIVQRLAAADGRIQVHRNPKRVVPSGMNIGIRQSKGECIQIVSGHCWLDPGHIRQAVQAMHDHPDAWRVGGVIETVGTGYIGQVIAAAQTHPVGVGSGNDAWTSKAADGYYRDVPLPVVRRWYYDKVGLFDEQLVRNQDTDLTLRAMDMGCVSYLSTTVRSKYFARTSFRKLFHQHFMDGYFRIRNIQKSRRPASPRQVVPLAFVLAWVVLILAGLFWRPALMGLAALAGLYLLALLGGAVSVALARGWRVGALTPLAFALMHFGYGLGSLKGVWAWLICRGRFVPRPEDHGITR